MAVKFSGARPMLARRARICLRLKPASIRMRVSSVSKYAQLPAEPLPKIVRRTGTANLRKSLTPRQHFSDPNGKEHTRKRTRQVNRDGIPLQHARDFLAD